MQSLVVTKPAIRLGLAVTGGLALLIAVAAIIRPEMMAMAKMHELIVGFGL